MKEYSSRNRTLTSLKIKQLLFKSFSSHTDKIILSFLSREKRAGNNLYQELSFQEPDALGEIDEGADLTGGKRKMFHISEDISSLIRV